MALYEWIYDSGAYDVEKIHRSGDDESLECEVDDCVQLGVVLISTKFGKSHSVIACYPHARYALEDTMWHIRDNTQRGIDTTIERIKSNIDDKRKLGFEYN